MWQNLAKILAALIDQYQKLQKLNEEKHGVLVLVKLKELEEIVRLEEGIIRSVNQLEKQRQEAIVKLSDGGVRIQPDTRMNDVWGQCPEAAQRELLYRLHKTLSRLVQEVQEASANNEILIASALEAVNYKLNQLGGSVVEPAYGRQGNEQVSHRKNFDLEA
ncbi:MAG: flagellar export chaperone FlgN [Anaerovibrio sp.]|nr:flagellar export chaperone FlgN [Anaerovibrio sp.]